MQILVTAASLAAPGGGGWGVERAMDRLWRPPAAGQDVRGDEEE